MSDSPALSPRELEAVALVVDGLTNSEIAQRMKISDRTVQSHVARAMRRTGTRSRTQLAVFALRNGLVPLRPLDAAHLPTFQQRRPKR